jgi:hypothetical protein
MRWKDKHKPKTFSEFTLPQDPVTRNLIEQLRETSETPYDGLLFSGSGGEGKTTYVDLLKTQNHWQEYVIDASGEGKTGLSDLGRAISYIPSSKDGVSVGKWLVIGHEISKSTIHFRDGLRSLMDLHCSLGSATFIFTDNDPKKLKFENPQIFNNSRVYDCDWTNMDKNDLLKAANRVIELEGYSVSKNQSLVVGLINHHYPAIRDIVSALESHKGQLQK